MASLGTLYSHLPHAATVETALSRRLPVGVSREDIEGVAWAAYHRLAGRLMGPVAEQPPAFVFSVVRNAIMDELRRIDRLSSHTRVRFDKIKSARADLYQKLGRDPDIKEVAAALGKMTSEVQRFIDVGNAASAQDFATEFHEGDSIETDDMDPLIEAMSQETAAVMREALKKLPKAERTVVELVVFDGTPLVQVAKKLKKPDHEVRALRDRAIQTLRASPVLIELAGY